MEKRFNDDFNTFYSKLRYPSEVEIYKVKACKRTSNGAIIKRICDFIDLLESEFSKEQLQRLYNNLDTLRITRKIKLFSKNKSHDGYYDDHTNTIGYYKLDCLEHELFHFASALLTSSDDKDNHYLGFRDRNTGAGTNEGYTQKLTEDLFPNVPKSYRRLVLPTTHLEDIIGKDTMSDLYLTSGLKGLVDELLQYVNPGEELYIKDYIDYMDRLRNCRDLVEDKNKDFYITRIYYSMANFLSKKLLNLVRKDMISPEFAMKEFDDYMDRLYDIDFGTEAVEKNRIYDIDKLIEDITVYNNIKRFNLDIKSKEEKSKRSQF